MGRNLAEKKVSIVLPCYNHGKYIADALNSILNQTYDNYEVFVFDNGSQDDSWDVISNFNDHRIRKIKLKENNLLEVKRRFIEMSTGNYCAILYSDDVWKPRKLEKQMEFLDNNPEAKICFTWAEQVDENLAPYSGFVHYEVEKNKDQHGWWESFLQHANQLSCPSMVCEKEIYSKHFGRMYPYRQIADMYCWMKILQETNLYIVEEVLTMQRMHEKSSIKNESARTPENLRREYEELRICLFSIVDEMEDSIFWGDLCGVEKSVWKSKKHMDALCDKFMFFYADDSLIFDKHECAIRFYEKYFDYSDGEYMFYQYLEKLYGFSRNDFFELTGKKSKREQITDNRMLRWSKLACLDFDKIEEIEDVFIYGLGTIGKAFYEKIKRKCKHIQFIDGGEVHDCEYDGIRIENISNAKIRKGSRVIVTPSYDIDLITEEFKRLHDGIEYELICMEDYLDSIAKDKGAYIV